MDAVLPLAITMMAGPQIITAILLTTADRVVKPSLAFIVGVAVAVGAGTGLAFALASVFGIGRDGTHTPSSAEKILQTAIIGLLILLTIKTYLNREKIKLPKWMGKVVHATPGFALKLGLMLIFLMPTDLAIMATVGIHKASLNSSAVDFVPFLGLTVLLAALPLILYLIFRKRAVDALPKVRAWMESNSWVVSIAAYLIFIFLLW